MQKMLDTFPKLLLRNYQRFGNKKVAMRHKNFGIWNKYTWEDYYLNVKYLSFGIMKLGLQRGDKVAIIGDNCPLWYWTELAAQAAGGITVGIFTDCTASEVKFFLEHSDSKFVFAHNQEQVDKVLEILPELPNITKMIYWSEKGLWFYTESILINVEDLIESGRQYEKECPNSFEEIVETGNGEDIAFILYTSGSTGLPKGALFSYNSYINAVQSVNQVNPISEDDDYVSFIPPAWAEEQAGGFICQLVTGMKVNFPESRETVRKDLKEIAPEIIFNLPRLWEGISSEVRTKMNDAKKIKKALYHIFSSIGYKKEKYISGKKAIPIFLRFLYMVADFVLFKGIRDQIGLSKVRLAYTGGAPISQEIIRYFSSIGVNIKSFYGLTEFPFIAMHRGSDVRSDTCGPLLPHWEKMRIDDGMILVKGNAAYRGYYKDPDTTGDMVRDGWYLTGDIGKVDKDGHLFVYGRVLDFKELRGGQTFAPDYLETRLRFSPFIKDCIVIGGIEKNYVSVMISIDYQSVGNWAKQKSTNYTTFTDLSQKREVYDLIKREIESLNRTLPDWLKIRKFLLLHKELDPDEGELTRNGKLRRRFIEKRYSEIIEAIYSDEKEFIFETEIIYKGGSKGVLKNNILIKEV